MLTEFYLFWSKWPSQYPSQNHPPWYRQLHTLQLGKYSTVRLHQQHLEVLGQLLWVHSRLPVLETSSRYSSANGSLPAVRIHRYWYSICGNPGVLQIRTECKLHGDWTGSLLSQRTALPLPQEHWLFSLPARFTRKSSFKAILHYLQYRPLFHYFWILLLSRSQCISARNY